MREEAILTFFTDIGRSTNSAVVISTFHTDIIEVEIVTFRTFRVTFSVEKNIREFAFVTICERITVAFKTVIINAFSTISVTIFYIGFRAFANTLAIFEFERFIAFTTRLLVVTFFTFNSTFFTDFSFVRVFNIIPIVCITSFYTLFIK
jgi:hypothetical protein